MSIPIKPEQILLVKEFFNKCKTNPEILHQPNLYFIKDLIEFFGGKIPKVNRAEKGESPSKRSEDTNASKEPEPKSESEESDLELDMSAVIEPDTDAPQKMGNPTLQPTEEEIAESQVKRSEAVSAFAENAYEKAIELYTEAIVMNPQAALLYAKRGQIFLLMNKPNACVRDCNRALELNPDSAAAHKFRGRAYYLLGKFEEAANDLRLACKFDYDEEADEWLREVTPNARKIEEHKRKKVRKMQEKLEHEVKERLNKTRENVKTYEENTRTSQTDFSGEKMADFYKFLNDIGTLNAIKDPEIAEAFKEISANPANILKYQNNPKIMDFICSSMFSGAGARMTTPKPEPQDDVGLD
ncbi:PREDICTED: putative protein FAM10A4 isoform X1 [Eufriesea mexicana]|uniref:putative protein FAM10A4 isoform X1 n=1 Tax=Eufriesea mexicana TaxID=516756 RepID=UPI00083C71E1|nr:PREDICTED: putative protein FAM10A4 isoform X1 [Eufriesea mexicana]